MRSKAEEYNLDSAKVIASGASAGGITALFTAYVQKAQYEGDSGNPGFPSYPNGVVSISATLKDEGFCLLDFFTPWEKPYICLVDGGNDNTNDIGALEGQPPLI